MVTEMKFFSADKRSLAIELAVVTAALLAVSHALFLLRGIDIVGQSLSTVIAVLFLYTPIIVLWVKRRPIDFLDRGVRAYGRSIAVFLVAAIIVFPPFFVAALGWQKIVAGSVGFQVRGFSDLGNALVSQLLFVALPEEFYFRGYVQSTLGRIFAPRWRLFGTPLGFGWIITAAVFAVAHSIVFYRWWHFAIFFPALLFGFLRERTGAITAPVLFHVASNLLMDWIVRCSV